MPTFTDLTCKQATFLVELQMAGLAAEGLQEHLAVCSPCRWYSEQSLLIANALAAAKDFPLYQIPKSEKERIAKSLTAQG